jgi:hypothetical protein
MRRAITALMLAVLPLPTVAASLTVETYRHPPNELNRDLNRLFLAGIGEGFTTYNEYLLSEKKEIAFCPPRNLALTPDQTENILLRYMEKQPDDLNKFSVSTVLLFALRATFPCKPSP